LAGLVHPKSTNRRLAMTSPVARRSTASSRPGPLPLQVAAVAELPTEFGAFRAVAFAATPDGKEHLALARGRVRGGRNVPVRVHSECLTGDTLGSLRCDCRRQLEAALADLASRPAGVLIYLRQEGRGIGLANKIRAYSLQDHGYDTFEANRALGFGDDPRDYAAAAAMLDALGVKSIELITNNPLKLNGLREHGVVVSRRIPSLTVPNRHNIDYLRAKKKRAGHWLSVEDDLAIAVAPDTQPSKLASA
jgi:GTP cyclohydrolase II